MCKNWQKYGQNQQKYWNWNIEKKLIWKIKVLKSAQLFVALDMKPVFTFRIFLISLNVNPHTWAIVGKPVRSPTTWTKTFYKKVKNDIETRRRFYENPLYLLKYCIFAKEHIHFWACHGAKNQSNVFKSKVFPSKIHFFFFIFLFPFSLFL